MNTGWELGRGERAGEKDLVGTVGGGERAGGGGGVMARGGGNDRGELDRGKSPVGKRRGENAGGGEPPRPNYCNTLVWTMKGDM